MGDWRAPLVAVESGRVKVWTTSARAGCMLYLYGKSGTTYLYVHLNNDLTPRQDDRGGCKPGVAYAPGLASGANVAAGQLLGFVGDSGDASGLHPHVHFELRPDGAGAISPFTQLRRAAQPLFALPLGQAKLSVSAAISLEGTVKAVRTLETGEQRLVLSVESVLLPGDDRRKVKRLVSLSFADLAPPAAGVKVRIVTQPVELNATTQLAKPGVLSVGRVLVLSP